MRASSKLYNSAVKQARINKASAAEKVPTNNHAEATFTLIRNRRNHV